MNYTHVNLFTKVIITIAALFPLNCLQFYSPLLKKVNKEKRNHKRG